MRTTLDLPRELLEEACRLAGVKVKTTAVIISLQKFIESKKIEKLRSLRGKIDLDLNLNQSRERSSKKYKK